VSKKSAFVCIFFILSVFIHAQEIPVDLSLTPEDIRVTLNDDGSCDLFVRKKQDIASILIMEFPLGDMEEEIFAYRAREWNLINGNERKIEAREFTSTTARGGVHYQVDPTPEVKEEQAENVLRINYLVDSTPEGEPEFTESFHIYIPPMMDYGYSNTRNGTALLEDGLPLNIRAFALPYADERGPFADNRFILRIRPPEPARLVREADYTPEPESADPAPEPEPPISADIVPEPEPPAPPPPKFRLPEFPFPLDIRIAGGVAAFFPGPEGKLNDYLSLLNQHVFTAAVSLEAPLTEKVGLHAGYDRDALFLNQLFLRAVYNLGLVDIEAGINAGVFNTEAFFISPGLSAVAYAASPGGLVSGSAHIDFALNRALNVQDDYFQDYYRMTAGVNMPAARIRADISSRSVNRRDQYLVNTLGRWVRYLVSAEFPLNIWTLRLEAGYQNLSWDYAAIRNLARNWAVSYRYWSIFTGIGAAVRIGSTAALFWHVEAPVYPWVYPEIEDFLDSKAAFLWQAELGVLWHLGPPR
jgi:hypothetical protein